MVAMTLKQFLKRMASPRLNLSALARASGVPYRTLTRLRNQPPERPHQTTMDAITPHLDECRT